MLIYSFIVYIRIIGPLKGRGTTLSGAHLYSLFISGHLAVDVTESFRDTQGIHSRGSKDLNGMRRHRSFHNHNSVSTNKLPNIFSSEHAEPTGEYLFSHQVIAFPG